MSRGRTAKIADDAPEAAPEPDHLQGWPLPRENPYVFGHDRIAAQFVEAFASGRPHHAWLLDGEPGIGKATLAYALARHVFACADQEILPQFARVPLEVPLFRQVATLSHPGLIAVRRPWQPQTGKFAQSIPVEEIRRLKHFFETTAATPWRVAIIDRADDLNINSANALLKLLEEPPARSLFFLINSAPARLFPTLRSRCARLRLRPLDDIAMQQTIKALATLTGAASSQDASAMIGLAGGSPRQLLELLAGNAPEIVKSLRQILNRLPELDYGSVFALIDKAAGGQEQTNQCLDLLDHMLVGLIRSVCNASRPPELDRARRLFSPSNLALWSETWERINRARAEASRLNLDRPALILTIFSQLQNTAQRALEGQSRDK